MKSNGAPARVAVTDEARRALTRWCRDNGPQTLLLSWPGGVVCLPSGAFTAAPFDVIVGHVAGCPIQADVRQLAIYEERRAVIDVRPGVAKGRPIVHLRPQP